VQLYWLVQGKGRVVIERVHLRLDPRVMLSMLRLSGSAVLQSLVGTTSYVGVVRIVASFGSDALAGYTIGIRLIMFALLPSWGVSNAAATLVGQNLGAGKPDRAETSVWRTAFLNMFFLGGVSIAFLVFAPLLASAFTDNPAVMPYAVGCLRIVSAGFVFYAYGMVLTASFNGAGDTLTPTLLNLLCFWLFEIPLAYVLARVLGFGPEGVFWALALSFSLLAVLSATIFRRGRWKLKRV
jgi:Na+-driven multidrug efflux pump